MTDYTLEIAIVLGVAAHYFVDGLRWGYIDPPPRTPVEMLAMMAGNDSCRRIYRRRAPFIYWGAILSSGAVLTCFASLALKAILTTG